MTRYFRDFYGCTASIKNNRGRYLLRVSDRYGSPILEKGYESLRGAKIAMGKIGDCWKELS